MHGLDYLFVALAALAAGMVNALAGGGTLITFPTLVALGVPAVSANVTNTVALCPGYLGATFAQKRDLRGQRIRLFLLLPAAAAGGIAGGLLLLHTGERAFRQLVPVLILFACALLALQDPLRALLSRRLSPDPLPAPGRPGASGASSSRLARFSRERRSALFAVIPILLAAVYGGYFGAGLSVILLAALGLLLADSITRLNALKQSLAFSANIAAAVFFLFSGRVLWIPALVMAGGALVGGALGGRLAGSVRPAVLRWIVVALGGGVALVYLIR